MSKPSSPHLFLAQSYWRGHLKPTDLAIDMTCGNGQDTLFLCHLLPKGLVIGIDIQREALEKTKQLLTDREIEKGSFCLLHQSHDREIYPPSPPRLIVYNLGYLPGGDKSVVTRGESTLASLRYAAKVLASDGALSITCYPGHAEGFVEEEEVLKWAKALPSREWRVCHHRWINREKSPSLLWIERID